MKTLLITLSCIVAFSSPVSSFADDKKTDETLYPFQDGKHWGFMDGKGKIVIVPKFDSAEDFPEGFAVVRKDMRYRFVNRKGQFRFHQSLSEFELGYLSPYSEGRA